MALHYDLRKIQNFDGLFETRSIEKTKFVPDEAYPPNERGGQRMKEVGTGEFETGEYMKALTWVIIHLTLVVGMSDITEEGAWEFFERIDMMQQDGDQFLTGTDPDTGARVDIPITYEDVLRHVGLHTNAPLLDRLEFVERHIEKRPNDA